MEIGEPTAEVVRYLKDADAHRKASAVSVIGATRGGATAEEVAHLLKDPDIHVRSAAARALRDLGAKHLAPALAPLSRDADPWVASEAIVALLRFEEWSVLPTLLEKLDASTTGDFANAAIALGECTAMPENDRAKAVEALRRLFDAGRGRDSAGAGIALLRLGRLSRDEQVRLVESLSGMGDLYHALASALCWTYEQNSWRTLETVVELKKPLGSVPEVVDLLRQHSLVLREPESHVTWGKLAPGRRRISDILSELLSREGLSIAVPEDGAVRLVARSDFRQYWIERLKKK